MNMKIVYGILISIGVIGLIYAIYYLFIKQDKPKQLPTTDQIKSDILVEQLAKPGDFKILCDNAKTVKQQSKKLTQIAFQKTFLDIKNRANNKPIHDNIKKCYDEIKTMSNQICIAPPSNSLMEFQNVLNIYDSMLLNYNQMSNQLKQLL